MLCKKTLHTYLALCYHVYFPSCEEHVICMDFLHSLDLELQTDVKTVQSLPPAQDYIKQGLLLPSASPYQVNFCNQMCSIKQKNWS